jgi:hypothetical protein
MHIPNARKFYSPDGAIFLLLLFSICCWCYVMFVPAVVHICRILLLCTADAVEKLVTRAVPS